MHDTGVKLTEGSVGAPRTATALADLDDKGSATYHSTSDGSYRRTLP